LNNYQQNKDILADSSSFNFKIIFLVFPSLRLFAQKSSSGDFFESSEILKNYFWSCYPFMKITETVLSNPSFA